MHVIHALLTRLSSGGIFCNQFQLSQVLISIFDTTYVNKLPRSISAMIYFPSCLYKLVLFTIRDPIKHTAFAMIKKSNLLDNE